ncbi:hypothetical protein Hamer_G004788, partial [Homarus americanus]
MLYGCCCLHNSNNISSALEYDELGSSSETESQSSSSSSTSSLAISPVVSSSNRKRATLKVITPELSSTLDLTGISHRSALRIVSATAASLDRLEKVEKEVQSLKGENLALKLVLEEKKTFASVVKDGEVEVDSWKVVAASATKCTLKRHSAVDLNNRFSTLSDECEEGASNTTSATPSVSVERGSSADKEFKDAPAALASIKNSYIVKFPRRDSQCVQNVRVEFKPFSSLRVTLQ